MAKISELISKHVISVYNSENCGVIENVLLSNNGFKAKYFTVYNPDTNATYVVSTNDIYSVGNSAVSVKNNDALNLIESFEMQIRGMYNPINSSVFNINGDYVGIVTDVELDEKNTVVNFIINNESEESIISKDLIAKFTQTTTIINNSDVEKVAIARFKPKMPKTTNDDRIISILKLKEDQMEAQLSAVSSATENVEEPTHIPAPTILPGRAIANQEFLLGRKLTKTITAENGTLIAKVNTKITSNTITLARTHGKLTDLTKHSMEQSKKVK